MKVRSWLMTMAALAFIFLAYLILFAGTGFAANILVNPGFETGALAPWFNSTDFCGGCTWSVTSSDSHTGTFSAMVSGNRLIEQDFDPVSTALITEVSLWLRMPGGPTAIAAVFFKYSDSSTEENIVTLLTTGWTQFDVTAFLDPGKSLSGVGVFGCTGCGGGSTTFTDDWIVDAPVGVPEPSATWALVALGSTMSALFAPRRRRQAFA